MTGEPSYQHSANLLTRQIAGETIIVPIRGKLADMQHIFALNEVGERVWKLIEEKQSFGEICRQIHEVFDVPSAQAENDVREFLGELVQAGLIEAGYPP